MIIKSKFKSTSLGSMVDYVYQDIDTVEELEGRVVKGVHGICFYGDKMVLVYSDKKGYWTPPGGGVEPGEGFEEALVREIKEETNMKVLFKRLIGFQDNYEANGVMTQTRSVCIVEPYRDFVSDPDGDITKIALINPAEYKNYFNWGENGDRIMERALELKDKMR